MFAPILKESRCLASTQIDTKANKTAINQFIKFLPFFKLNVLKDGRKKKDHSIFKVYILERSSSLVFVSTLSGNSFSFKIKDTKEL